MRVLGIGDYLDLGDLYLNLLKQGHDVRAHAADPAFSRVMRGLVPRSVDWRADLEWVRAAGRDGVVIVETADRGALQDELRAGGVQVIGGCALGDRLEGDREFAQGVMRECGMRTAPVTTFSRYSDAIAHLTGHPQRCVYKHNGHRMPADHNYVGELEDGSDVVALLDQYRRNAGDEADFILMDHIDGVEMGVGAYFDGAEFLTPACLDWEHKHFFDGDLGELTGEMGTVVSYRGAERLFGETLGRMAPRLRAAGYVGYINLNTMVNAAGVWPLEFTCRFGYPGFAILDALHEQGWEPILRAMLRLPGGGLSTASGFAVGVVLTTPPFPAMAPADRVCQLPISFRSEPTADELRHLHFAEVETDGRRWSWCGPSGYALVATGSGETVEAAQLRAYGLIGKVVVPNGRYRSDIGTRLRTSQLAFLASLGY